MWDFASELGSPTPEMRDGQVVRLIRPQPERASPPNTLSSRYGLASFPFHTDAAYWPNPPRFVILRCVDPGEGNRCTLLTDTYTWLTKGDWDVLTRAVCMIAGRRPFLATIAAHNSKENFIIRYDSDCMKPTSECAHQALTLVSEGSARAPTTEVHWRGGDLLIVDNHRLLHARGESPAPDPSRSHQKMLVKECK